MPREKIKQLEQAVQFNQTVIESVPTAQIVPSPFNVRKTFDATKMAELKQSIINFGLQNPICVRSLGQKANGQEQYEIVHGERRWRAFRDLGICQIDAIVWDVGELNDTDVAELSLIENLIREDLNPIEEVEGIIKVLSLNLQISEDSLVQVLHRFNNEISRRNRTQVNSNVTINFRKTGELTFTLSEVQAILDRISTTNKKISIFTLVSHRLPLLRLPPDLDQAVRQKLIEPSKALSLGRVKDDDQRAKLLQEVYEQDLSVREIKSRISNLQTNLAQDSQNLIPDLNRETEDFELKNEHELKNENKNELKSEFQDKTEITQSTDDQSREIESESISDTLDCPLLDQTDQAILRLLETLNQIQEIFQQLSEENHFQNIKRVPKQAHQLKKFSRGVEEMKQQVEKWIDIQEDTLLNPHSNTLQD